MTRESIILPEFEKQWKSMRLTDIHLQFLQEELATNPKLGTVIQHANGLRKYRFAFSGKGKSGSSRVLYAGFPVFEKTYLITAYPKSAKEDLTSEDKQIINKLIRKLESELRKKES